MPQALRWLGCCFTLSDRERVAGSSGKGKGASTEGGTVDIRGEGECSKGT